jgi:hypothetical protein
MFDVASPCWSGTRSACNSRGRWDCRHVDMGKRGRSTGRSKSKTLQSEYDTLLASSIVFNPQWRDSFCSGPRTGCKFIGSPCPSSATNPGGLLRPGCAGEWPARRPYVCAVLFASGLVLQGWAGVCTVFCGSFLDDEAPLMTNRRHHADQFFLVRHYRTLSVQPQPIVTTDTAIWRVDCPCAGHVRRATQLFVRMHP